MSSVYFHTPDETVSISGSERAYFGWLCHSINESVLELETDSGRDPHWIREWLPADHYSLRAIGKEFAQQVGVALRAGCGIRELSREGKSTSPFALALNTALVAGSEPVRIAARIHGQCEAHGWVDGQHRNWMANVFREGLRTGVYRASGGWEKVIDLLRRSSKDPVVMSYSVCQSFPNEEVADFADGEEAWSMLTDSRRWELAFAGLKKRTAAQLEIHPYLRKYYFDSGLNAFQMKDEAFSRDLVRRLSKENYA